LQKEKMDKLKWGIIGLGNIAQKFANDLVLVDNSELIGIASREATKAKSFAIKNNVQKYYSSYKELFNDPEVDIIYVATPHNSHADWSILAMNSGKHILCEKPLAVNQKQVISMIEAAQRNNVFLMEAFWSRFNPSIREAINKSRMGELGDVNYIHADFSFTKDFPEESRALNLELAGGSILDIGVYPIFLVYSILGMPKEVSSKGTFHKTGADIHMVSTFTYDNGFAHIMSGFNSKSDMRAKILGTSGSIFVDPIWHETESYSILDNRSNQLRKIHLPTKGKGFTYEIDECFQCIQSGKKQSALWSWQNSKDLASLTDTIRSQIGLKYPFE
jgi:predicted dehydrogenase